MSVALLLSAVLLGQGPTGSQSTPGVSPAPKLVSVDIQVGKGDEVALGDLVTVDYTGKFLDGKVFDTSKKPDAGAFSFVVGIGEVIKGWDQGVIGMKAGGVRKLTVPPDLAYGATGFPPKIAPNTTLVFTIAVNKVEHVMKDIKTEITKAGTGEPFTWGNTALLQFAAKTPEGATFYDTSKQPATKEGMKFTLGRDRLVQGFSLGVLGMKAGERRTITVPPRLAFGAQGIPKFNIKPNSTITFDVELLSIVPTDDPSGGKENRQ